MRKECKRNSLKPWKALQDESVMSFIHNMKTKASTSLYSSRFFALTINFLTQLCVKLIKFIAITGRGSTICLKNGFLPLPVHFYSPVPDLNDLVQRKVWDMRSELKGIDFREEYQMELLKELGSKFSKECQWPLHPTEDPYEFNLLNSSFSYGCAASTHCMIRYFKPDTVVEIGSGMSSKIISRAIELNNSNHNMKHILVDPYPADFLKNNQKGFQQIIESRVETVDTSFFEQLKTNDILFIDSGHCVRIGGDVNYLYLDILPRLAPGVIVHIHDIQIPFEYPREYATSETFRQFWSEQYLLHGFLCFNSEFEILLAMQYLMKDKTALFKEIFTHYDPKSHPFLSSSFWIRRRPRGV